MVASCYSTMFKFSELFRLTHSFTVFVNAGRQHCYVLNFICLWQWDRKHLNSERNGPTLVSISLVPSHNCPSHILVKLTYLPHSNLLTLESQPALLLIIA